MARSYGLSRLALYREVILPGALPSILVGLRFSLGLMWVMLIVAETISAQSGIGYMTMNAREFLQTDVVLVGILLYALLGKLADVVARGLERGGCAGIRPTRRSEGGGQHDFSFTRRAALGALASLAGGAAFAQGAAPSTIRIGYQKSSTLTGCSRPRAHWRGSSRRWA